MSYARFKSEEEVKNHIDNVYEFIQDVKKLAKKENNFEDKCSMISMIGDYYSNVTTGVYADDELENMLCDMAYEIDDDNSYEKSDKANVLIVMTLSAPNGGHSVLVNNWIRWDEENVYSLVMTGQNKHEVVDFIKESVTQSGGDIYSVEGNYIEKAKKLRSISENYNRIILFTHMNDVIPVLAYGKKDWKVPIFFYNHADFRFSFGFSISDAVLNLTEFDKDITSNKRGVIQKNIVLSFPNSGVNITRDKLKKGRENKREVKKYLSEKYDFDSNSKIISTAGDNFKFTDIIGYSFTEYVEKLLAQLDNEAVFIIIGPSRLDPKWVDLEKRTYGRGKAIGYIPREDMEKIISVSDLFVTSFPMAGFGMWEAMKNDVPYLCLDILGRHWNRFPSNCMVKNIDALIEKSIDALGGNGSYYNLQVRTTKKSEWCQAWNGLINEIDSHERYLIKPKREIGQVEIVNCQVMATEKRETDPITHVIENYRLGKEELAYIIELDEKYKLGIVPNQLYLCERVEELNQLSKKLNEWNQYNYKMYRKCDELYSYAIKLARLFVRNNSIYSFFHDNEIVDIFIYGYGNMGKALEDYISGSDITISGIIDKNIPNLLSNKDIILKKEYENVVIVNTTVYPNEEISKFLGINEGRIISLFSIIDSLFVEEKNNY